MDIENETELLEYLRREGRVGENEAVRAERLAGGVSNRTMRVRREGGADWVIKQALPKLRVEADWFCNPARIHREAAGLRALHELLPEGTVPELIFADRDEHLLAMSAVPEPHDNLKTMMLCGDRRWESAIGESAAILATIHRDSARIPDRYEAEFQDRLYFESLRLEPYYGYAAEQTPRAKTFLNSLMTGTRERRSTLVHGDFSPKNMLYCVGEGDDRVSAGSQRRLVLLDHEVMHWGDPAFDCGFFLAHLLSKAHHLAYVRGEFLRSARLWLEEYLIGVGNEPWASDLQTWIVRHTLGCLLARVRGRSTLEYLSHEERDRQASAVVDLMTSGCRTISDLWQRFPKLISYVDN